MALRIGRPRPLPHDENAENSVVPGKARGAGGLGAANKGLGLKPQQQQPVAERKKLSNITNQLLPKSGKGKGDVENVGGSKTASQGFSIKVDAEFAATKAGLQDASSRIAPTPRYPLKNITNGGNQRQEHFQPDDSKLQKKKADAESQSQPTTKFNFPPSSALNLTEEMKKKAAEWAEEGIERVHFSGKDMEELREKLEEEEMQKRLAAVFSCRSEIPFPRLRPPEDFSWGFPDVLELDVLKDLDEDANLKYRGLDEWSKETDTDETLLGYTDYFAVCSPPRFTDGWPQIREEAEV